MNYMNNPKQLVMQFLNGRNDPTINKLMNMSYPELEQFATNFFKERGIDLPTKLEEIKRKYS